MTEIATQLDKRSAAADVISVAAGYKRTEVGIIPGDGQVHEIGAFHPFVTSGSRGWARYYADQGSLFLRITNLSRESIHIGLTDLRLVNLPKTSAEGLRTRLRDGDLLVSVTADIGIIGFVDPSVPKPAYINQHIALVRFDGAKVDTRFLSYFLASEAPQRTFKATTDQGAKAGLNLESIRRIKAAFPSLEEQRTIAAALSDVDRLIAGQDQLIAKKQAIKQGAMEQLLTGRTRLPGYDGGWSEKPIGSLLTYERPDKYIVRDTDYVANGQTPVLTANKSLVLGYTDEEFGIHRDLPAVIFDDFTTDSKYVEIPFKVKSSAIKILKPRSPGVSLPFVFERMQLIDFPTGDHKRYYISEYQHLRINVPELVEQYAISGVLADLDAEIEALERRRRKAKAIKQGMLQALLSGRVRLINQETAA